MIEITGIVCRPPAGREIGRRGYLRAMVELSPWWLGDEEHYEILLVHMDMDWDLAGAWIETDVGQRVRAIAERIEIGADGNPDAPCTSIEWA